MSAKTKKILNVVTNILIVLVILFALVVSITSITAKANGGVPDLLGYTAFSIQTDSMKPTISSGDYIFGEKCDPETLKVGDVITYFTIIENQKAINTHRIVDIVDVGSFKYFQTQGDNTATNPEPDELLVDFSDVISKYNGTRIPFMGSVLDFLGTKLGFFLFIVLPVLLYTLYQVYKLILVVINNQKVKMAAEVGEATEEMKQAVIAEYLAKQKAAEKAEKAKAESADQATEEQKTEDTEE